MRKGKKGGKYFCVLLFWEFVSLVKDVRVSPALTFEEMSRNSKRYLATSGEWELVDILGETSILQFGIDEWDIITFWVKETTDVLDVTTPGSECVRSDNELPLLFACNNGLTLFPRWS